MRKPGSATMFRARAARVTAVNSVVRNDVTSHSSEGEHIVTKADRLAARISAFRITIGALLTSADDSGLLRVKALHRA
jgi:hypothetical protein